MAKEQIVQQPPTVSAQKRFTDLPAAETERSTFDRSHGYKTTMDSGRLVPIYVDEVLPGDTFNMNSTLFVRMATPLKPVMDSIKGDIHYFFVPNRLTWDSWPNFMGERDQPSDDPATYVIPRMIIDIDVDIASGTLADYFGLPLADVGSDHQIAVTDLPFRAYELIFDEWYRDENVQTAYQPPTGDGDRTTQPDLAYRNKRKDYFTSALPWPQKGDPVFLPLGTTAPVVSNTLTGGSGWPTFTGEPEGENMGRLQQLAGAGNNAEFEIDLTGGNNVATWGDPGLVSDLTEATAATINDIRTAFQIQKLLERDARGGTRYIEIILNHFNVESPDMRLQRPEYLGGGTGTINFNPVAATATDVDVPQGNLSATATGVIKASFNHSFVEHGYVMALFSIRADLTYQNGVERFWSRESRYDFYWPALSHLGEQPIENREIFHDDSPNDVATFGFQERYAEYRFRPGRITGKMRSNDPESLDVWHLAQDFQTVPGLNTSFLIENPPINRVIAVPSEPQFIVDGWHNLSCTRPMPVYSVPGLVDHF